jgi:anthranilate phosphoribosyltransferase
VTSPGTPTTWPVVLSSLLSGSDLDAEAAGWAMDQILTGEATSAQVAGFVVALRAKGESPQEVDALVSVMLRHARLLDLGPAGPSVVLDVVGTGGDQSHTVNISTMAALVCAAAGAPIVKHGNRAASSSTGTADVLEELGVAIDLEPALVARSVNEVGIGFCFAQTHHPAMRHAGPTRRELGVPTVFNILGPLTNPGGAQAALIGCASPTMAPVMADVLHRRGVRALVVRGEDGLDEISTVAATRVWDCTGGSVIETTLDPRDLGIDLVAPAALRGGDRVRNAELLRKALGGVHPDDPAVDDADAEQVHAIRDAVALNAAAALVAYDAALLAADTTGDPTVDDESPAPLAERVAAALPRARQVLDSGAALTLLDRWIAVSSALRP